MKKGLVVVIAIIAVIAVIAGVCIGNYNTLVVEKEKVAAAEANIDTYLQRRADLIPNIVATVKNFAEHETEVYQSVLEARQALMGAGTIAEKSEANEQLSTALQGLNVVVEAYPELKSDKTYVALMDELEGSENRIATARKDYNDVVETYNSKIVRFPASVFAKLFGFEKAAYFEAQAGAENAPDVNGLFGD